MNEITAKRIGEIKGRLALTTGGNWSYIHKDMTFDPVMTVNFKNFDSIIMSDRHLNICPVFKRGDADFLAHSCEDVAWLISELESLHKQLEARYDE